MLARPRLLAVLAGRWDRRVTAVVAGAGFGKSTLLAEALAENALDPAGLDAWVACDRNHTTAASLAAALALAVHADPATIAPDAPPDDLATALAEAVAAHAPVDVAIVVDDAHHLPRTSGGGLLLAELVEQLPANGHLVLSARRSPPVPLARLVARGEALILHEEDLAFDDDELEAFAALRDVPLDQLAAAGRWPAIVELQASANRTVVTTSCGRRC